MPDRNFICPKFFGRDRIIEEIWKWLGESFVYAKVLAGDGGKGKTSIAYEFAQEVCRVKPYQLEKVIWLTAKSSQFVAEADRYVNVPETHFSCTESLLRAICSELAILDEETEGASVPLLKKILRAALALVPTLVVVDDVDSVEPEEQKGIIETAIQMASSQARFLLTTPYEFLPFIPHLHHSRRS